MRTALGLPRSLVLSRAAVRRGGRRAIAEDHPPSGTPVEVLTVRDMPDFRRLQVNLAASRIILTGRGHAAEGIDTTIFRKSVVPIEGPMPINAVRCHVSGASVMRVTDLEGGVLRVICPELDERDGQCHLRTEAQRGGPLSQLLDRVDEDSLDTAGTRCILR